MNDPRPNPDTLLERVAAENSKRGRLKIYLGMAAGSGKTYTMLNDAIVEKRRGLDVVAGYIEPHGRVETEQLAARLEAIPLRMIDHNGVHVPEFDIDAALKRQPEILLIDELAHTNAVGSRHVKRWQDVKECLNAGINVYTTLNVQHIESLVDVVTQITRAPVKETVPDTIVRNADEVELIDITPDELIQRLKDGKVYVANKVETALQHFFKRGNLLALRELVLRVVSERAGEQLITHRRLHNIQEVWPANPRILVCVSPNLQTEHTVRAAARLASAMQTELVALSVDNLAQSSRWPTQKAFTKSGLDLAEKLGAQVVRSSSNDVVAEILRIARQNNASIIVVGKPPRSRLREYLFGSVVDELVRQSGDLDVYVVTGEVRKSHIPMVPDFGPPSWRGGLTAMLLTLFTTLICLLLYPYLQLSNLIMLYLLVVAWAGSRLGRFEAVIMSALSVLAFDFCFVPPRWTFAVADVEYVVTFAVMLVVGILISTLSMQLKTQAELSAQRERRTAALYRISKLLATATTISQIATIVRENIGEILKGQGVLFMPTEGGELEVVLPTVTRVESEQSEMAVARWVSSQKMPAGVGTDTLSGSKGQYQPLLESKPLSAVLGIYYTESGTQPANDPAVDAFANQVSSAIERLLYEQESTVVQLQVEREKIRNLLLSSISHDFRSPLAAISGATETLLQRFLPIEKEASEMLLSIKDQSNRLSRLVRNVLDLTRLESGKVQLKIEWESVEELIGTALEQTSDLLGARQIDLEIPAGLPLIQVDAILIEQVFVNLLENIAKHTSISSRVTISASIKEENLSIVFQDNGPGLPKENESQLFEKSFRNSHSKDGFGLGLIICRAVVELHGGRIAAGNAPGGGARFELLFRLPQQQPEVVDGR